MPFNGAQLAVLVAVWSTAAHGPVRTSRVMLATGLALAVIAPLRQPYTDPANTALAAVLLIVVHLIGSNTRLRRDYLLALEERAERLERERDVATEVAAARERTRIARELHDVVAHHVSVMVVQAEGAGWAVEQQPERARTAIATVTSTGRTALTELRRLLGVLRSGDEDGVAPQPGLGDLEALVSDFRSSGIQVSSQVRVAESLNPGLQLAAYRIIQEGLTNVLKHAGPRARAEVRVRLTDDTLTVEIEDDGKPPPASDVPGPPGPPGHGLIGINERAVLFGGTAEFGPGPGGGFRVRVTLPAERDRS